MSLYAIRLKGTNKFIEYYSEYSDHVKESGIPFTLTDINENIVTYDTCTLLKSRLTTQLNKTDRFIANQLREKYGLTQYQKIPEKLQEEYYKEKEEKTEELRKYLLENFEICKLDFVVSGVISAENYTKIPGAQMEQKLNVKHA